MTLGTRRVYPDGQNIEFSSKLQCISPGEVRGVQRLKYREYDEESGPNNVNRIKESP